MAKQYDDFVKVIGNIWNSSTHINTKDNFDKLRYKVIRQVEEVNEGNKNPN